MVHPLKAGQSSYRRFKVAPIFAALLTCFPLHAQQAGNTLPDLSGAVSKGSIAVSPRSNGVTVQGSNGTQQFSLVPEYTEQTGFAVTAALASMLGDSAAVGLVLTGGPDKREALINAGFKFDQHQRIVLSVGQLKQFLDFNFRSGVDNVELTQNEGAINYQFQLGEEFLRYLELTGYLSKAESRQLAGKTFAVDTATLYELWNDPRRIAGGKVSGVQGRIGISPVSGSLVKVSVGQEKLSYDLSSGKDQTNRLTGGVEWQQELGKRYLLTASADAFAAERRYGLGLQRTQGPHRIGLGYALLSGRDGLTDDHQVRLSYSYLFGGATVSPDAPRQSGQASRSQESSPYGNPLLSQVVIRPGGLPSRVIARVDETAAPVRLITVDKTALPAGSSVNAATGAVTTPLGVAVTGIAGVTLNAAPFVNTGQFALSGNNLVIDPNQITQPAVGVTDTYVVTVNNSGGGTTLVTVNVSRGSVRIDSIVVSNGAPAEIPPVMGDVPNQTATAGSTFSLNVAPLVTLTNGDAVTAYTLSGTLPTGVTFNNSTGVLSGTPTQTGTFNLSVTATDNDGVSNSDAFTLTVSAASDTTPDAFSFVDQTNVALGSTVTSASIVVSGINAATSITVINGLYSINGGAFTSTNGTVVNGDFVVVRHTASGSNSTTVNSTINIGGVTDTFSSTTVAANAAPTLSDLAAQNIAKNANSGALAVTVGDTETAAGSLVVAASSSNTTLLPNANLVWGGSGANRTLTVTPAANQTGTAVVTYAVTDGGGTTTTKTFNVTVAGSAPVMGDVPNQTATAGSAFSLNVASYVTQTNGDAISAYTLSGALPTGLSFNGSTGVLSGTPTQAGAFNLSVTATDSDGVSNSDAFTLTVNVAPDSTPDAFDIPNLTNQTINTVVTTGAITVAGINIAATATTTVGTIVKNGSDTGGASTTVNNGDSVAVRLTTSGSYSTAVSGVLNIEGVTDSFSVTTVPNLPPTGQNIVVDAAFQNSLVLDLTPYLSDPENDPITATLVSITTVFGDADMNGTAIAGNILSIGPILGGGNAVIEYRLNDSPTNYTIQVNYLSQ